MKTKKISKALTAIAFGMTVLNASAQGSSGQSFQQGLNIAAGVIITISIIWSVTTAWSGIHRIKEGDPSGKNAIWAAILIFLIPLLVFAVVRTLFSGAPAVTPTFDF